jgi:drug/metabolite transporter (DMT)-like permease
MPAPCSRLGYLYMGTACAAWVLYGLFTRKASARNGRITVTFWQILFGLLGCLPFALAESAAWKAPSLAATLNVLYLGIFCSALGYWLYVSALDLLGPATISIFINLIPVVAVVAAYVILGERLQGTQWLGGIVAVAGVYFATYRRPRERDLANSVPPQSEPSCRDGRSPGQASVEGGN